MCTKKRIDSDYGAFLIARNTAKKHETTIKNTLKNLSKEQLEGIFEEAKKTQKKALVSWISEMLGIEDTVAH